MKIICREVDFNKYCNICKYKDTPENEDPCNECLSNAFNLYSDKPVEWEVE